MSDKSATRKPRTVKLNIRRLRTDRGLTMVKLAEKSGVHFSIVQRHEAGDATRIDLYTLARIKTALRCEWSELLTWAPGPQPAAI